MLMSGLSGQKACGTKAKKFLMDQADMIGELLPIEDGTLAEYADRGGLGLYVSSGEASFKDVTVEPLTNND